MLPSDPLKFGKLLWPKIVFYKEQKDIIYSVRDNDETIVPAGNMLGKDFVSAFIILWFFLTRSPCRIVTTSADYSQLESVLWGEIRRFLQYSKYPLTHDRGGPLIVNHLYIRKVDYHSQVKNKPCGISYIIGRVAAKGEGMLGHHVADPVLPSRDDGQPQDIPRTLYVADEASGVDDISYERADTWAKRKLVIGNPYPCENFFFRKTEEGDKPAPQEIGRVPRFYQRVINICAEQSPNVRYAQAELEAGKEPSYKVLVPGVLGWRDYVKRRQTWDPIRQQIGLDGKFYKGQQVLMYPPDWLDFSHRFASDLRRSNRKRVAKGMGVDPAEGVSDTAWTVVDELGVIDKLTKKTPDTNVIPAETLNLMWKHRLDPRRILFDAGGGGTQIAHRMRAEGYAVRTAAFAEPVNPEPARMRASPGERKEQREVKYTYKNRRAKMYGQLRDLMDPQAERILHSGEVIKGFAIQPGYVELRRQLAPIPLLYDGEGRMYLPPKYRKDRKSKGEVTLEDIIGCSPDEADSLVLAVEAMLEMPEEIEVGAF